MRIGRVAWRAHRWAPLCVAALAMCGSALLADSWLPPEESEYSTPGKTYRFRVIPRGISSPLAYFRDEVSGHSPAGQDQDKALHCTGILEHRSSRWRPYRAVWQKQLVNDVAPVRAVISGDGRFVETFDNWHSTGYGPHTVVLYGADGRIVRSLNLYDFLLRDEIEQLSMSVSSIHWLQD